MKLTVLGASGPFAKAGGACSSYLLTCNDENILLDCGNGSLAYLLDVIDLNQLSCVVLTHLHHDHIADIHIMNYAIGNLKAKGLWRSGNLPLFCPGTPENTYDELKNHSFFDITVINETSEIAVGSVKLAFEKMTHPYECYAVSAEFENKRFVYSGDSTYNKKLVEFARNTELFLCDACVLEQEKTASSPHMTPQEAGQTAKLAKAKQLVITHTSPLQSPDEYLGQVRQTYPEAVVAKTHDVYAI